MRNYNLFKFTIIVDDEPYDKDSPEKMAMFVAEMTGNQAGQLQKFLEQHLWYATGVYIEEIDSIRGDEFFVGLADEHPDVMAFALLDEEE